MGKHTDRRNMHTIYLREQFKPHWKTFLQLIKKDKEIVKFRSKTSAGLISVAIMKLIFDYIEDKKELATKPDINYEELLQEEVENEASN